MNMKINELNDHCGSCPLIGLCGEPYEEPHICADGRFYGIDTDTYKEIAAEEPGAGMSYGEYKIAVADHVAHRIEKMETY